MSIGRIVVDLLARTGSFETDIDRAAKRMEQRAKDIDAAVKKVGTVVGVAFSAAGAAVASWTKDLIASGAEIDKLSQLANTNTTEFQKWSAGASLVGIQQEKLGDILKDVNDKVGEFLATGGGPLKDFFDNIAPQIGVTAKSFQNLSGPQALGLYVSSLEKAGLNQAQMTFYMEALANDATALLPLLKNNAQGMREAGDEAERFGAILSEETLAAAEAFRMESVKVDQMLTGLKNRIAADMLPTLTNLTDQFFTTSDGARALDSAARAAAAGTRVLLSAGAVIIGAFKTVGQYIGGVAAALVQFFTGNFAQAWETAKNLTADVVDNIKSTVGSVSTVWDESSRDISRRADRLSDGIAKPITNAVDKVKKAGRDIKSEAQKAFEEVEKQIAAIQREIAVFGKDDAAVKLFDLNQRGATTDQLDRARKELESLEKLKKQADLAKQGADVYEQTRTPVEQLNIRYAELNALLEKGAIDWDTYARATFAAQDEFDKLVPKVEQTRSEMDVFAENAAKNMQDAFADLFFDPFEGGLKGMVSNFANALRRMAADALAADLVKAIFGAAKGGSGSGLFGSILSAGLGLFGGGSTVGAGGAAVSGVFSGGSTVWSGLQFADGGIPPVGKASLVGERGPELFVPNTAGRIIPNEALGGNQSISYSPVIQIDSRADRAQVKAEVDRAVKQGNADLVDRLQRAGMI